MSFLTDICPASPPDLEITHQASVALIGTPKYSDDFTHFNYVNPQAPKGGKLRLASIGSFDSLNQYADKGQPPELLFMLYDRLMTRSQDEPYSLYPLAAMSVEYPEDLSWVAFNLNPDARFHDGHPMTSKDVVFTVNTLKALSSPFVKKMVTYIQATRATSRYRVQFELSENSRTLKAVALLAYLPVLPEHYWKEKDFNHNHLDIPLGSGPMKIAKVESGRSITFERVTNYWGANLPVNKGQFNFDRLRIDYYRDNHAALEAFAAGAYDLRIESDPRN
ncbi:MAG: ABC transporter substrate-binding protein, partial [Endozoicomonas sp.]